MPPRKNDSIFIRLPTYRDGRFYRNALRSVRDTVDDSRTKQLLDELRERYEQQPLPVQVDDIDFSYGQLSSIMSKVYRKAEENGNKDMETAWAQCRRSAEALLQPTCSSQQLHDATSPSSVFPSIQGAQNMEDDFILDHPFPLSPLLSSLPHCSSTESRLVEGSSSFIFVGQSSSVTDDMDTDWFFAPDPSLSPSLFLDASFKTPRHPLHTSSSPDGSTDNCRTSEWSEVLPSHLSCPPLSDSSAVQPCTSYNPFSDPAAQTSQATALQVSLNARQYHERINHVRPLALHSYSNSNPHHDGVALTLDVHSSLPDLNYGSDSSHAPTDEISIISEEVPPRSPIDSRAAKRPRLHSPHTGPRRSLSTNYVAFSLNICSLVTCRHAVITAEKNVYYTFKSRILAKYFSDPRAIRFTALDRLHEYLYLIGHHTFTNVSLQTGTLGIITEGRPVDVERALDAVRWLMVKGLFTVDQLGVISSLKQFMRSRETYFSNLAMDLRKRDQEVSSRETVLPELILPYEQTSSNSDRVPRQEHPLSELQPYYSHSSKGSAMSNSFSDERSSSQSSKGFAMQDVMDLMHMTLMGQHSIQELRLKAVFCPDVEQHLPPKWIHRTLPGQWLSVPSGVLPSKVSDEDWDNYVSRQTDSSTYSPGPVSCPSFWIPGFNSRSLMSH